MKNSKIKEIKRRTTHSIPKKPRDLDNILIADPKLSIISVSLFNVSITIISPYTKYYLIFNKKYPIITRIKTK